MSNMSSCNIKNEIPEEQRQHIKERTKKYNDKRKEELKN